MYPVSLAFTIFIGLCLIGSISGLRCRNEESVRGVGGLVDETKANEVATCPGFELLARCVHVECSIGARWLGFPSVTITHRKCLPAGVLPVQALVCAQLQKDCEQEFAGELEQKMGIFSGLAQVRMDKCELCTGDMCNDN